MNKYISPSRQKYIVIWTKLKGARSISCERQSELMRWLAQLQKWFQNRKITPSAHWILDLWELPLPLNFSCIFCLNLFWIAFSASCAGDYSSCYMSDGEPYVPTMWQENVSHIRALYWANYDLCLSRYKLYFYIICQMAAIRHTVAWQWDIHTLTEH